MKKTPAFLLLLFLSLRPALGLEHRYCVQCRLGGTYQCSFDSKVPIGPKPGRLLCSTYLSEERKDRCEATHFSFFSCGNAPQMHLHTGKFSPEEWHNLNLHHFRSLFYITVKGAVNLLEQGGLLWSIEEQKLSPSIRRATNALKEPLEKAHKAQEKLFHQGQGALQSASKKLESAGKAAKERITKAQESAQRGLDQVKEKAKQYR